MTDEESRTIANRDKEFSDWRKAEADKLPELANRIFALRSKMYMGCGLHWSLEKRLGSVMRELNNYDSHEYYHLPEAMPFQVGLSVSLEALYDDVDKAERSIRNANPE